MTDTFMPGDELVETIRYGYSRAGLASPFTSFPVGLPQCLAAVEELRRCPAADSATLARLEVLLVSFKTGVVEADIELALQMYLRSSEELIETSGTTSEIDLYRLYLSEPAPLRFSVAYAGESGLSVRAESAMRREYNDELFRLTNFWQIMESSDNPVGIENHDFTCGYVAWSKGTFRALFGRDKIHFGAETFSSLLPSDRLPYYDALRVSTPLGPVHMDWYLATIVPYKLDGDSVYDITGVNPYGYYGDSDQTIIVNALHRFEWRSKSFRAAITGNEIYVRANNYFELADFFPAVSWHSSDVEPNNLCVVLDFSWDFLPGWTISGQAGYDDVSATIVGVGDNGVPTIDAYILGLRWDGGTIQQRQNAQLEFGYTHYLWGNYGNVLTGQDDYDSGTLARAIFRFRTDWGAEYLPLTSPYGPGALWLRVGYTFQDLVPDLDLQAGGLLLSKNTKANLFTDFVADSSIENATRILYGELSLGATYEWAGFMFKVQPLFAVRDDETWVELTLGVKYGFHFKKAIVSN